MLIKKNAIICGLFLCGLTYPLQAAERFDVNMETGTPILEAVKALGARADKDVVVNGEITGTISLHLENTTFGQALDYIAKVSGFNYSDEGKVILVSPTSKMSTTETFKVKYLELEELKKQLGLFIPSGKINIDKESSTISVDGNITQIAKVREFLWKNDVAQKQINVQALVIELSKSKAREMGLDFSTDSYAKGDNGISWLISSSHEETKGFGNVLARPAVTVFNGKEAKILIGDKVPVFTSTSSGNNASDYSSAVSVEYKEVGVKLNVTPRVNDEEIGTVTMDIHPSISTITKWVESGNNKAPQISTREASTILRVKEGETIYLGGLLRDEELKNIKGIPFLSKIPILGELFKHRSISKDKKEIIIAITPTIIKEINGVPQFPKDQKQGRMPAKISGASQSLIETQEELENQMADKKRAPKGRRAKGTNAAEFEDRK
jgi:type II secretory pathway component GspD/PulD (secretin)